MIRLSLRARVALIVILTLFALWLTVIAAAYLVRGMEQTALLPAPRRLQALARLMERTPVAERAEVLAAVRTPQLAVWVEPGWDEPGWDEPVRLSASDFPTLWFFDQMTLDAFAEAMADRPLAIRPLERRSGFGGPFASALNALEFRLRLATGETLVVTTETVVVVVPFGLPVGLAPGLVGLLFAVVALIFLHREFRPLTRLASAVDSVDPSAGDPPGLPEIKARSPEVQSLVSAFERLHQRVSTLIRARMALVGGIQHDLRTFATRLRLRVDKIADAEERARAAIDISDMIALMDDALLASRAGANELDEELIDLAPFARAEVADRQAGGAPIDIAIDQGAQDARVIGDRLALRRILANLIDNALRYGGRASIAVRVAGRDAVITVDDAGPGIPADRRQLLLEPFTRNESSRARRTGGAGLGLAVVRSLMEAHGGTVAIEDAPDGGARLLLRLPLFRA